MIGTTRLGTHILKKELFDILWNNPTNIICNKSTLTPVPKQKNILMNSFVFDRFLKLICPRLYINRRNVTDIDIKNSNFVYKKYNLDKLIFPYDKPICLTQYFSQKKK